MISISKERKADVAKALEELAHGSSFEDVGKKLNPDVSVDLREGGGALAEEELSPQIRKIVEKLKQGEMTRPISMPDGSTLILKLVEIKTSNESELAKNRDQIYNRLASAEYQKQISLWIERQKQKAVIRFASEPSVSS